MLDLLSKLCELPGTPSMEDKVRDFIQTEVSPHATSVRTDPLGNLIVEKKGKIPGAKKLLICAHMDEVGIIITGYDDKGFLKFDFAGGVDRRVAIGKSVHIGDNAIVGLIGIKAYHMVSKSEEKNVPKTEELYIDIGATSKEEAMEQVPLGDYGVFVTTSEKISPDRFKAKAIDDRLGCAIMMILLQEELPMDVTFVFSVMEEVGTRGIFGAGFAIVPDIALVLETTTAADLPEIKGAKQVCHVGSGPVIGFIDGSTIYDRKLFELLRTTATESDIPWQIKSYISGGNDARALQRTKEGIRVAGISAPIRYLHAPASVGSISDFENCLSLSRKFIAKIAQMTESE